MPSVGPLAAGFKQAPAGGYLTIISSIDHVNNVYQKPVTSGSGGSATVAAPVVYPWATGGSNANFSSLLVAGRSLKDMGTVHVSSGRVFRKFKAVAYAGSNALGDAPSAVTSPSADFGTFYLETMADGGEVPAAKVSLLARSV
jgi:hypothetical protein